MKKFLIPLMILLFMNCGSDDSVKDFTPANEEEILEYISAQGLNAQRSDSGLYYVINEAGSGSSPTASSNVTVAYRGYFTNGTVFDESNSEGISFDLSGVIAGWTEGITYFNEGGSGILLIPSRLAYGTRGRSGIPGGAVLIFDIALISVN
jgi:FKBP-type peptidyl-prolyl cis-trans isomerase FkpA